MSWKEDFYTACNSNGTFSAGINEFFQEHKEDAVAPFAKYQLITAVGTNDLQGVGDEGERNIQLSVWTLSPTLSESLALAAKAGVKSQLDLMSVFERPLAYEEDTKLHGYAIDFIAWFDNP